MKLILALALFLPSAALAETIALSPEQIEAAKEAGARAHAGDAARGVEPNLLPAGRDRQVHGEVGVTVGTGGYSELYGTAIAPIGDTGVVAISVAQERGGRYYGYQDYGYPGRSGRPR